MSRRRVFVYAKISSIPVKRGIRGGVNLAMESTEEKNGARKGIGTRNVIYFRYVLRKRHRIVRISLDAKMSN